MPGSRSVVAVLATLVLVACAPVRVRETATTLAAQSAREATLSPHTHWRLAARIAVSSNGDGGSGDLQWQQADSDYVFTLHAPVNGKTWKLSGGTGHALLEGVDTQPTRGNDAEHLLHDRLGWDVPLADLAYWIRGLRAGGGEAQLQYGENSLPALLEQHGWKVEYRDWFSDRNPPLPRKVFATRGDARVRVAIESWSFDD